MTALVSGLSKNSHQKDQKARVVPLVIAPKCPVTPVGHVVCRKCVCYAEKIYG